MTIIHTQSQQASPAILPPTNEELKLYTVYSPPEHRDRTIHKTKADALAHEEHFDGKSTE